MKTGIGKLSPRIHLYHKYNGIDVRRWDTAPAPTETVSKADLDKAYGMLNSEKEKVKIISEKLNKAEEEKVLILSKIKDLENKVNPPRREPMRVSDRYDENRLPQTEEEWTALFDENPSLATDLRTKVNKEKDDHQKEFQSCVEELKKKHPDMYLRDDKGNFVLDRNGNVQPDTASPKFKIFDEIAGKDPTILTVKHGPRIVMEAMEGRLRGMDEAKVKEELELKKKKEEEERQAKIKAGQVASGGAGGKEEGPEPEIKYNSQEEEAHVKKAISRGLYKDEKEYFKRRDVVTIGYGRGGF